MLSEPGADARFALMLRERAFRPSMDKDLHRPTVCALVFTPDYRLVLVRSANIPADTHAFSPPQGGVHPGETFVEATERELGEELGYLPTLSLLDARRFTFLGCRPHETRRGKRKELMGVFVPMNGWVEPVLNRENSAWTEASCYLDLARDLRACSEGKREAVLQFVRRATEYVPMFLQAWGPVPAWFPESVGVA